MPGSDPAGKVQTAQWVKSKNIKTVLDIGPGMGTYSNLFKQNGLKFDRIDGIEIWEPYINDYDLKNKYNNIFIEDVRVWEDFNYDLVIFGDVLEHMTKEESISVWKKTSMFAKYAIISIPIIHYPQGEWGGNPYEEHIKDDWSTKEVLETFSNIVNYEEYPVVGVFYAEF